MHERFGSDRTGRPRRHGPVEDALALLTGTLLVALGVQILKLAGLATGGTVGIAFLAAYATGWPIGWIIFAVNLPFYLFAWAVLGPKFTVRTFAAVGLLSAESLALPALIHVEAVDPTFAAVMGGLLVGVGLLALIRHKASLGGIGVLAVFLQERFGWRAGSVQMGFDCLIVAGGLLVMDWPQVLLSVLGAVMLNVVLAINHRPGRYAGVS
ncbi:YitT family protein [Prosthecomicrobium sp. N25]|uniref:YitT family protein n=1 Tax=Prosthecomicrobium sp. N25 TaxID=3129254 RepID=UPI0030781EB1